MKSPTSAIIKAMRILARDIESSDGVANSAIAEAADRLEELQRLNDSMQTERDLWIKVGREKLQAAESEIATQKNLYTFSLKRIDELLKELHEMRVELTRHKKKLI
jgi:hypothetical protein